MDGAPTTNGAEAPPASVQWEGGFTFWKFDKDPMIYSVSYFNLESWNYVCKNMLC